MPPTKPSLKPDASGQYARNLGWLPGRSGQKKFRLGRDLAKAELAHAKLGLLWRVVEEEQESRPVELHGNFSPAPATATRAVWTDEALVVAEAIRKHQHAIRVGPPDRIHGDAAYAVYLDSLHQRFGHLIQILPADDEAAERGRDRHAMVAEHRARQTRHSARIAAIPLPAGVVGTTLYQAIDAYAAQVLDTNKKESGKVEAKTADRLKRSITDLDLGEFGYSAMERIRNYWSARPEAMTRGGRGSGKPISVVTVDNHLSTARRFVRWLDRADAFDWEMPRHGLDALKVNLKRLHSDAEVAERRHGVKVFTVEQLGVIYRHATDFERLLVLLGLNAAMAQAEIATLRRDEIEGSTIKRIRRKSGVYAEFALWPETQQALDWWSGLSRSKGDLVMLTDRGRPYTRQRISNAWGGLGRRIEGGQGDPPSWWLPFKHLRKTAAQLVREASDGEIAGVFLSHGKPVASDDLADAYSNRPFDRVALALGTVRTQLDKVLEAGQATPAGSRMR